MSDAQQLAIPEWTEYREKNGLDPLGMQTSSVALYQALVPGISNVTLRIRYYGLYAWLAQVYSHQVHDTNTKTWQRFVRRAEALYALIAQRAGNETGVAGVTWASNTLAGIHGPTVDFAEAAEPGSKTHYLKQAWGAYGAAYASQLYAIGIYAEAREHQVALPSETIGEPIADEFARAIGPAAPNFIQCVKQGRVTLQALDGLAVMLPSRIRQESAERDLYEKILFGRVEGDSASGLSRRQTLILILNVVAQLGRPPTPQELKWVWFSGRLPDGTALRQAENLNEQRQRWWAYQLNELVHVCYEWLLKRTLDELERYPSGARLQAVIGAVASRLNTNLPGKQQTWGEWRGKETTYRSHEIEQVCNEVLRDGRTDGSASDETGPKVLRLLASAQREAESNKDLLRGLFSEASTGRSGFHSIWTELQFLETLGSLPLGDALVRLIDRRVIQRHLWVAMRKLRHQGDYTFLIEADNGLVWLKAKDGPVLTNPRLSTSLTFLKDIHLIAENGVTDLGRSCVAQA